MGQWSLEMGPDPSAGDWTHMEAFALYARVLYCNGGNNATVVWRQNLPTGTSWSSGVVKWMEATRPAPDLDNAWTCTRYVTPSSRSPILRLWTFCNITSEDRRINFIVYFYLQIPTPINSGAILQRLYNRRQLTHYWKTTRKRLSVYLLSFFSTALLS